MENNRNFFITIALSVLILTLWQVFYMNPRIEPSARRPASKQQRVEEQKKAAEGASPAACRNASAARRARVPERVPGTDGATLARAASRRWPRPRASRSTRRASRARSTSPARASTTSSSSTTRETVDKDSPEIQLLNPSALPNGYFAEIGFVGNDDDRYGAGHRHASGPPKATRR